MKKSIQHLKTKVTREMELDYLLYLPANASTGPLPLLLFLHGMGERGSDLNAVKVHGPPKAIENGEELPFVVAAPQCPMGRVWQTELLLTLIDELTQAHDIDLRRIYVTGLSMGGTGTWALANEAPDRFAGVAPICGPFTMIDPANFANLPVWCFHGAMDQLVPITDSLRMVKWIRDSGGDVRLTTYADAGHDAWTEAYTGTTLYDWLLTHQRG